MIRITTLIGLSFFIITSCNNDSGAVNQQQGAEIKNSIQQFTDSIAKNVSREGPLAWLRYFEDAPGFFMSSEGQLAFSNYDSAKNFINNTLVKTIRKIELHWSNLHVDPLTNEFAVIAANFHEDITDSSGKTISENGYFTGLAHQTPQGWKLRNLHWSTTGTH